MYHLRFKGNHYDIGVTCEKILQKYFKEVCEEIKGLTDTIGVDYYKFASWLLAMGCCMYNLEDNFPLEVRGCTAFAINYKYHMYYGRNNDLPPYLKKGTKS